jgi:hypothetical protein
VNKTVINTRELRGVEVSGSIDRDGKGSKKQNCPRRPLRFSEQIGVGPAASHSPLTTGKVYAIYIQ